MSRVRSQVESCAADDWRGRLNAWIDAAVDGYFEMMELHDVVIYGAGMPFRYEMTDAEIARYLTTLIRDGPNAGPGKLMMNIQ